MPTLLPRYRIHTIPTKHIYRAIFIHHYTVDISDHHINTHCVNHRCQPLISGVNRGALSEGAIFPVWGRFSRLEADFPGWRWFWGRFSLLTLKMSLSACKKGLILHDFQGFFPAKALGRGGGNLPPCPPRLLRHWPATNMHIVYLHARRIASLCRIYFAQNTRIYYLTQLSNIDASFIAKYYFLS